MSRKRPYKSERSPYECPLCLCELFDPQITPCGHTFCKPCIAESIKHALRCPKCSNVLSDDKCLIPNSALMEILDERKTTKCGVDLSPSSLNNLLKIDCNSYLSSLSKVSAVIDALRKKKRALEQNSRFYSLELLLEFLKLMKTEKIKEIEKVQKQIVLIEDDMNRIKRILDDEINDNMEADMVVPTTSDFLDSIGPLNKSQYTPQLSTSNSNVALKTNDKIKIHSYLNELHDLYMQVRSPSQDTFEEYADCLRNFMRVSSLKSLGMISYNSELQAGSGHSNCSVVSSIDFNCDQNLIAIAGVALKIKVFRYDSIISGQSPEYKYPVKEFTCSTKISCISWNRYYQHNLASSDYGGVVTLWDTHRGIKSHAYQEHQSRCWCVDFSRHEPSILASGSDDRRVLFWSINSSKSVDCIEMNANVCSLKFAPDSSKIAVGTADHLLRLYDTRKLQNPIAVFKGHQKGVSYINFLSPSQLVSAATHNQLRLWNLPKPRCVRVFQGHTNVKNFVGLSCSSNYIATGSENNSLYVYYAGVSSPLISYRFESSRSLLGSPNRQFDDQEFVSAVCFKPNSDIIAAGNSQGIVQILEMV